MEDYFNNYLPLMEFLHTPKFHNSEIKILHIDEFDAGAVNLIYFYDLIIFNGNFKRELSVCCKKYLPFFKKKLSLEFTNNASKRGRKEYVNVKKFRDLKLENCNFKIIPIIGIDTIKPNRIITPISTPKSPATASGPGVGGTQ